MSSTRLLVVEDEDFTRALIVNALQSEDFEVALETSSATYALKTAPRMKIQAAVLDLDLGRGPSGLDLALGLRRKIPNIGIIFLTSYRDPRLLSSQSNMAPFGSVYLQKTMIGDISRIKRGIERSIENAALAHAKSNVSIKTFSQSSVLTDVQIDIVRMVSEGKSNQEIASLRDVTEKSIEQTLSRILKKTNIEMNDKKNRRVELALYYLRQTGALNDEAV